MAPQRTLNPCGVVLWVWLNVRRERSASGFDLVPAFTCGGGAMKT